tara:strand:- start:307 stop:504 length:198 start_codon:yes stop_codon:yes gene_type:complete
MITAILITLVISTILNVFLLMIIGRNQEGNYRSLYKHHMWDEITEIRRTVKAINEKVENSTIYKT